LIKNSSSPHQVHLVEEGSKETKDVESKRKKERTKNVKIEIGKEDLDEGKNTQTGLIFLLF